MPRICKIYCLSPDVQELTDSKVQNLLERLDLQQASVIRTHTGSRPLKKNSKMAYKKHVRGLVYFCSIINRFLIRKYPDQLIAYPALSGYVLYQTLPTIHSIYYLGISHTWIFPKTVDTCVPIAMPLN